MRTDDHHYASSSTMPTTTKPKRRTRTRLTVAQIQQRLQLIGELGTLQLDDLPSRPPRAQSSLLPASSSSSNSLKRKAVDTHTTTTESSSKRARLNDNATPSAPSADGSDTRRRNGPDASDNVPGPSTLTHRASTTAAPVPTTYVPVRRPRTMRSTVEEATRDLATRHERLMKQGSALKYSGDARRNACFPTSNKHYRPLPEGSAPEPGSLYHTHGTLIARLESLEALLTMAYAVYCNSIKKPRFDSTWGSFREFSDHCKNQWQGQDKTGSERDKAFLGLIYMLEAFIIGRRNYELVTTRLCHDAKNIGTKVREQVQALQKQEEELTVAPVTPRMLPSPASINSGSANSTPNHGSSTPSTNGQAAERKTAQFLNRRFWSAGKPEPPASADQVQVPVDHFTAANIEDAVSYYNQLRDTSKKAQMDLSLPVLHRAFPRTFSRVVNTSYSPEDEMEPDLDDNDGELFWPGAPSTGDGLAWVCLLGRSMIWEYGSEYGYQGFAGVIPRPPTATGPNR